MDTCQRCGEKLPERLDSRKRRSDARYCDDRGICRNRAYRARKAASLTGTSKLKSEAMRKHYRVVHGIEDVLERAKPPRKRG